MKSIKPTVDMYKLKKKPKVYTFELKMTEFHEDDRWDTIHSLKTDKEIRESLRNTIREALNEYGFNDGITTEIKILPNKKKRVYTCGE
jgi:hypothetical protein